MTLMGYADQLSARPGEQVAFKVSCDAPAYRASLVRFVGSMWPKRPIEPERLHAAFEGEYPGRAQTIGIGSWVSVDLDPVITTERGLTVGCFVLPGLADRGAEQTVWALCGSDGREVASLAIDDEGRLVARTGEGPAACSGEALSNNCWYSVVVSFSDAGIRLVCRKEPRSWLPAQLLPCTESGTQLPADDLARLLIGASSADERGRPRHCFNGKIARPVIAAGASVEAVHAALLEGIDACAGIEGVAGVWDFSRGLDTATVEEVSGHNAGGVCHNHPMRAVVGPGWTGREVDPRLAPAEYDAIAFHEDDLDDCRWETDFTWTVPEGLAPGVYGVRLESAEAIDHIPLYIRSGQGETPAILYLAPTNTYLAYGNERLYEGIESTPDFVVRSVQDPVSLTERDYFLMEHPEIGSSVYDVHPDHTGICYSSRLRPVVTMRAEVSSWTTGHPRHFSADLFLIEWLEHLDFAYDVATDEDLHIEGVDLLEKYAVIVTGSHPEYWTTPALDALERYLAAGGRCMYLGGNGFYWVTGISSHAPHVVEIRRGINGTRAWTSHPGEVHLSTTGELGGLWRYRGRAPNRMMGVGFTSQGWGGAPGYTRLPDSADPRAAFVFEGIGIDEPLGDFGLVMGGAAGDEIDRYDPDLGSPPEGLRLATTEGQHTDYYQVVIEDCTFMLSGRGGTEDARVRSDIVLVEDSDQGGAVFSVGSINWIGSLMWNGGVNSISRMTANVLRRFQERSPV
ncbi:MAG: hypothetical protein KF883_08715 [Thermomicrobiales bacterium]|nr:hypothetical protein [Thermomicrobiales bacterium]